MKHQEEEVTSVCESCGASVYRQHIDSGIARYEDGKLLCSHCVAEYERSHDAAAGGASQDVAPIELEGDDDADELKIDMSSSRIHGSTQATLGQGGHRDDSSFKRSLQPKAVGATRCRTFHCRISDGAVDFLNNQVNEWIDGHDDIVIKFATSTIGMFEGKHTEPNMILTVFY